MKASKETATRETVLIVDDDAGSRAVIARMLEESLCTVVAASSGAEAMAVLDADRGAIGTVVTDIAMPDMSGVELAYYVREHYPWLAVAIVSGDVSEFERSVVTRAGVPFLKKPVRMDTLLSAVREARRRIGEALATED